MARKRIHDFEMEVKPIRFGPAHRTMILFLLALVLVAVALLFTVRIGAVEGTEVGIMVNNLTGEIEVITNPGTQIYNGIYKTFHKIDKTEQKLEMAGDDQVRIKTRDGSDVNLDLTIQYRIDMSKVRRLIDDSGVTDRQGAELYKQKWARDYSRSICRSVFGELTTEQFYDTGRRTEKAIQSMVELNDRLGEHGMVVTAVIPGQFRFYEEYETKIKEKKLADQAVEEQRSQALAAEQAKERQRVEATKAMEVAIAEFEGKMTELVVAAKAEAERAKKAADAYAIEKRIGAEAGFYRREKNATAILATKKAEAEGIRRMSQALEGEGGLNIVKLEYSKRLRDFEVSGQPFTREAHTSRFEHIADEDASAARRGRKAPSRPEAPPQP